MKLGCVLSGLICLAPFGAGAANADSEAVGYILDSAGACTVKTAQGSPEAAVKGRELHARDQIQCADDGKVTLQIGCDAPIELHGHHDPLMISAKSTSSCDRRLADLLMRFGQPGGRERSTGALLYSPADQYAAAPATLVLRWQPLSGRTLRFELRQRRKRADGQRTDAVLWNSGDVDGALGSLESGDLRKVLAGLPPADDDEPLMMWMLGAGSVDQVTRFHLLSAADEHGLAAEIDSLKELPHDAFLQHVARADVFKHYDLYPEAAEEYEAALELAPDNIPLHARAREVYELTGNVRRAREL
jgi:hypothetical protein